MARILLVLSSCLIMASSGALAQPLTLTTTFAGGNSFNGNMFDVEAISPVTITGFDVNVTGTVMVEVYYRPGSYLGFQGASAGWTLAGGPAQVTGTSGVPTPVPFATSITIPATQTYGLYVTVTSGTMNYTNGSTQGALFVQDANMKIFEGHGGGYPFNLTNVPRVWNGNIHYNLTGPPPFQLSVTSTPAGVLTFDLQNLPLGVAEGWTFATGDTSLPAGTGPFFGITPDPLAYVIFNAYPFPTVGHPFHWLAGFPGLHPAVPYSFPAGTTSGLSGVSVDFLSIALDSGFAITGFTNTARLSW